MDRIGQAPKLPGFWLDLAKGRLWQDLRRHMENESEMYFPQYFGLEVAMLLYWRPQLPAGASLWHLSSAWGWGYQNPIHLPGFFLVYSCLLQDHVKFSQPCLHPCKRAQSWTPFNYLPTFKKYLNRFYFLNSFNIERNFKHSIESSYILHSLPTQSAASFPIINILYY